MKNLLGIILLFLFSVQPSSAYKGFDVCNHGKETVANVICDEPTVLLGTTITGDIHVVGSFTAKNILANSINVKGSVSITDSKVNGDVDVVGKFTANNVEFSKGVTIESTDISINKTQVKGSMLIASEKDPATLRLSCKSTVVGSVVFDGKEGVIQVSEDSIVQGKIINGSLEFIKASCD